MKLYVGNIGTQVDEEDLRVLFGRYGRVINIELFRDFYTDRPLGYAFVEMPNGREAERAIRHLNRRVWRSRQLQVREREPSGRHPSYYRDSY